MEPKKYGNASVLVLDDEIDSMDEDDQLFIDFSQERQGAGALPGKGNTDMKNILGYLN